MTTENQSFQPKSGETTTVEKEETMWAMFCHLSTFIGLLFPLIGNIAGPFGIWLLKRDEYPLVDDQGKEAMNFQITMTIYYIISILLIVVIIGIPLLIAIFFFDVIMTIIAMFRASEGIRYRYPLTIRLIK